MNPRSFVRLVAVTAFPAFASAFLANSEPSPLSKPLFRPSSSAFHQHETTSASNNRRTRQRQRLRASSSESSIPDVALAPHYTSQPVLDWLQKMADSYKFERGEDLLEVISREDCSCTIADDDESTTYLQRLAASCATTNLPIASHDFLRDPTGEAIYCYGNLAFLSGFGYECEEFVALPSKYCVLEDEVKERQKLLDAVKASAVKSDGSKDDDNDDDLAANYDNLIRVRKDGGKILLKGVNLWNVYDIDLSTETNPESVRRRIEGGDIDAIGQAVWIRHVEYL